MRRILLVIVVVALIATVVGAIPALAQTGGQPSGSPTTNVPLALAPLLIASFAIQQLLEFIDPSVDWVVDRIRRNKDHKVAKSWLTSGFALVVGLLLAWPAGLRALVIFQPNVPAWIDIVATGLFLSGGTDGVNSLLKLLGYAKENQAQPTPGAQQAQDQQHGLKDMHL